MATPKKTVKKTLIWKKHPDGGEYASYKLGAIFRYKGKYKYRTSYKYVFNAKSLVEAKRKIDVYSKEMFIKNKIEVKKTSSKKVNKLRK